MSYFSEEYVNKGHALTSTVKVDEDPMPISFSTVKHEPEERNPVYQPVTGIKKEYEDHSQDPTSEVKFEKDPETISFLVVKREPEERNLVDQHVTGIKEEYQDQSHDLTSEIKLEEDPVPISFPVVKREPEEGQSDFNEEPRVEVTTEDKEFYAERCLPSGIGTNVSADVFDMSCFCELSGFHRLPNIIPTYVGSAWNDSPLSTVHETRINSFRHMCCF
ncbi:probable serine/threonine-protein kinase kinX isoform X6 [Periplaneta americana]|uniref:probable serine/threonine-protein kinase kinX isoform X6 n=1 Tax=Periplaneta americana TaxID=6978 RepID=UPI0037E9C3C5